LGETHSQAIMMRFLYITILTAALASGFSVGPAMRPNQVCLSGNIMMQHGGKGFGGGEATRDPEPTYVDPNDPKGKQQAIHKAESFADYLARRSGGGGAAPAPAAPAAYEPPAPAYSPPAAYTPPAAYEPPAPAYSPPAAYEPPAPAYSPPAAYEPPAAYTPPSSASSAPHGGKGFGGGEATRDPEPTYVDPNDPKGKQQAIHKAESFADYLARRQAGN